MRPAALRFWHVSVSAGGRPLLDDVSLAVAQEEIVGLIGPNGAGKSTLLDVASGFRAPERGSVFLEGRDVRGLPPHARAARGLGRTFQDADLFAGLTVAEMLALAVARAHRSRLLGSALGLPWVRLTDRAAQAEAARLAERAGLLPWFDARAEELSTGVRRLCDLSIQAAARPRVLLLDEPAAGVAEAELAQLARVLRELRADLGCAVLLVDHDLDMVFGASDRVCCLVGGHLVAEGTPDQLRADTPRLRSYRGTVRTDSAAGSDHGAV